MDELNKKTFEKITDRLEELAKTTDASNKSWEKLGWVISDPNVGIIVQIKTLAETMTKIQTTVVGQQEEINLFKQWIKNQESYHEEEEKDKKEALKVLAAATLQNEIDKKEALKVVAATAKDIEIAKNEALTVVALAAEKASDKADKRKEPLINNLYAIAREIVFAALTGAVVWLYAVNRLVQK